MRKLLSKLWADDGGFIISVEMLFICVILVIGIIGGLAALRAAVATELAHLGNAILELDPGFNIVSVGSSTGSSNGTLVTHIDDAVSLGAANAVATNTTVSTDVIGTQAPFPLPLVP
jgi:hypothetical protein